MEENTVVTEEPVELTTVETEVGEVVEGTPETITPVDSAIPQEAPAAEEAEVAEEPVEEETTEEA